MARSHLVQFVVRSPGSLPKVRAIVSRFLDGDLPDETREAVMLSLNEILANAITHEIGGPVVVHVSRDGDRVSVTVRDRGTGFDPHLIKVDRPPDPRALGGRGLYLAIQLMDSVTVYSEAGTIVHMSRGVRTSGRTSEPVCTYASSRTVHFVHPDVLGDRPDRPAEQGSRGSRGH
jgi:anti-sigma regulatory factor (Ser/Thr protein kinase)